MKKVTSMVMLSAFIALGAQAQSKAEVKPERTVKVESKQALQKAAPAQRKVSAATLQDRAVQVKRVESKDASRVILTEEKKNTRSAENAAKAKPQKVSND